MKVLVSVSLVLFVIFKSYGQTHSPSPTDTIDTLRYIKSQSSFSYTSLRDKGNSALFYTGLVTSTGFSYYKRSKLKEFELGVTIGRGTLSREKDFINYNQTYNSISLYSYKLWNVYQPNEKLEIMAGAGINSMVNIRVNPALFNANSSIENLTSLNLHGKIDYNFTKAAKSGKVFGLFKYNKPERKFTLSNHIAVSALPISYRPGFVYVENIVVDEPEYFENYQLQVGGFQLSNEITLTKHLPNGNDWRIGYRWNAVASAGRSNKLEVASHGLVLALMFNYKK